MVDIAKLAIEVDSSQATAAAKNLDNLSNSANKTESATKQNTKASAEADKANAKLGRSAGQAAIQIQQFTGQVQGGTNWLMAMSQQAADVGFVVGAPLVGAILAMGAGLAYAIQQCGATVKSLDELSDSVDAVSKLMEQPKSGVMSLSEELRKLAKESESAARIKILEGLAESTNQMNDALTLIEKKSKSAFSTSVFSDFDNAIKSAAARIREGSSALETLGDNSIKMSAQMRGGMNAVAAEAQRISKEFGLTKESSIELIDAFARFSTDQSADGIARLQNDILKIAESSEKAKPAFFTAVAEISEMGNQFNKASGQAAELSGIYDDLIDRIEEFNAVGFYMTTANSPISAYLDELYEEMIQSEEAMKRLSESVKQAGIEAMSPYDRLEMKFGDMFDKMQDDFDQGLITVKAYLEASSAYYDSYYSQLDVMRERDKEKERQKNMAALGALGDFFGNMAAIAEKGGEDQFETWKRFAQAQAAVSAALAITNALSVTPTFVALPLAASIGALAAVQIAEIENMKYQGARELGGQVQAGQSYLVGERGPEIVTMGGNGYVTPNSQISGGGLTVVNQVQLGNGQDIDAAMMRMAPQLVKMTQQAVMSSMRR